MCGPGKGKEGTGENGEEEEMDFFKLHGFES